MAALGLKPEDFADDAGIEVWPCCWASVLVFERMATQWNVGPGGLVGLRYEALPVVLDMSSIPLADRPRIFSDVQTMEHEVMTMLREK